MPDLSNTRERPPVLREEVYPRRVDAEAHRVPGGDDGHPLDAGDQPNGVAGGGVDPGMHQRLVAEGLDVLHDRAEGAVVVRIAERDRLGGRPRFAPADPRRRRGTTGRRPRARRLRSGGPRRGSSAGSR